MTDAKSIGGANKAAALKLQEKIKAANSPQESSAPPSPIQQVAGMLDKAFKSPTPIAELQTIVTKLTVVVLELQSTVSRNERNIGATHQFAQNVDQGAASQLNTLTQQVSALNAELHSLKEALNVDEDIDIIES